jgi:hypothetical protein
MAFPMTTQNYNNFDTSHPIHISDLGLGVDRQAMYRDLLSKPVPARFLRLLNGEESKEYSQSSGAEPDRQTGYGTS